MARTKQGPRKFPGRFNAKEWNCVQRTPAFPFNTQKKGTPEMIRKYYPKRSRFFWKGLLHQHQASNAEEFPNPKHKVLLRYKRDFFKAFCSTWTVERLEPARIPLNLEYLSIFTGSPIFMRKLIKQNKRLKHIELISEKPSAMAIRELKYCRNLCSISFLHGLPNISEQVSRKLIKSFGKTLLRIRVSGSLDLFHREPEELSKTIENLFKFPKLQEIYFQPSSTMNIENFPYQKLEELEQTKNVACNLKLKSEDGFKKGFEERPLGFKPIDFLRISMKSSWEWSLLSWSKMSLDKLKTQHLSCKHVRQFEIPSRGEKSLNKLLEYFKETPNLEIAISSREDFNVDYSKLGELSNLKQFSFDVEPGEEQISLKNLFQSLTENVKIHRKLDTLFMRVPRYPGVVDDKDQSVVRFFKVCSEILRKAYFEFPCSNENSREFEPFYEGLEELVSLKSLNILLSSQTDEEEDNKQVEKISQRLCQMNSVEELELNINNKFNIETLAIKFPPQLKKLALRLQSFDVAFEPPKALWSLSNLIFLELELDEFAWNWQGLGKVKSLEVLILKEAEDMYHNEILITKEKLDGMMKECLNLKLIIFADARMQEVMIFKREYSWPKINSIVDELSFEGYARVGFIKSYDH